jgi:adenine-specific DNA-methyltransferase
MDFLGLLEHVDFLRIDASRRIDRDKRSQMGQFLTPAPVAKMMASMFQADRLIIRLLDAGAGVGTLSAAFIEELCSREHHPQKIEIVAYEIEPIFMDYLKETMNGCKAVCNRVGIEFQAEVLNKDFIEAGTSIIRRDLPLQTVTSFDCAILNPPYRKIHSRSRERLLLNSIGLETGNLYTGFLAIVMQLLKTKGELVAITPRSFCNGPYFKSFRKVFLENMVIRQLHLFNARNQAFKDDVVLQENVICYAEKEGKRQREVTISTSEGPNDELVARHSINYSEIVNPRDPDLFIHMPTDRIDRGIADRVRKLTGTLDTLGIMVSTGRVVDFRAKDYLKEQPTSETVPLIYPGHFKKGFIEWPKQLKGKPNAIDKVPETENLLVPPGVYVLVKRFSTKEERKRVVAALYDSELVYKGMVGFENHLNYFHINGRGLSRSLAKGLAVFLNSTLVDSYFRQFSGHTQVNATDLRKLKYPSKDELETLGSMIGDSIFEQNEIDNVMEEVLTSMSEKTELDPIGAMKRIEEAIGILRDLGLPRAQVNERSALTLLALLDMGPETLWSQASPALRGISEMMSFFKEHYGKEYAPNTRETVRRFTVHQFIQAGFVIQNPDDPHRPTNSPNNCYQISQSLLNVLRAYGTADWDRKLREYLASLPTLADKYAKRRKMMKVPLRLAQGKSINLSPGGQNELVVKIIEEFCPRFTPGAHVIYVGDTADKWAYFDASALKELGIIAEEHGKMPDVIVYYHEKDWLVLIEACKSHGPVDHKRHIELKELFKEAKVGLVFVTALPDKRTLMRYLEEIAWETEVWVAEQPDHLIHFNGERFLGPYDNYYE